MLRKLVVCGVGLIGGSFALALKQAKAVIEVVGIDRDPLTLDAAMHRGVVDAVAADWPEAMAGADLVMLGMPVGQMAPVMAALAPHLAPDTVITDGGSTKSDVVAAARHCFGDKIAQFVPGHPIAGAEKSGVTAATATLYQGKRVVLTPLAENGVLRVERVRAAWQQCGAQVSSLQPSEHDAVFAAVSHLPHLLAYALVHDLANRDNSDQLFGFAASGFRDFTRIASSHPEMWRDICIANREALLREVDAYMAELMRTRAALAAANAQELEAIFTVARARRDAWLDGLTGN